MKHISQYLSLVKFSHTIFAMPFAMLGFFIASWRFGLGAVNWSLLLWVVLCMVTARNAAMAFNRWADRTIDIKNPRTRTREIPSGLISSQSALWFIIINSLLFVFFAYQINAVCFALSPVALAIVLGYSYTKRFSWLCHLFLGLGLSLAPLGAYLAVAKVFDLLPLLYAFAVITWVAGFDIIYALQDIEFDRGQELRSIPARFGMDKALWISTCLHVVTAVCIVSCAILLHTEFGMSFLMILGSMLFLVLLFYQHWILKDHNLDRINLAFFTTNGIASVVLACFTILDFYF